MHGTSSEASPARVAKARASSAGERPIRLLYLRDTVTVCGPGKTILNTCRTLDATRFHLTVAATRPEGQGRNALLDALRRLGAPAVDFAIGSTTRVLADARRLAGLIREHDVDILQTHDFQTRRLGVIASALTGVPHVTSVHGWIFNSRRQQVSRWMDMQLIRLATRVITVSGRLRDELVGAGVPAGRITVLRNAVLLEDYAAAHAGRALRSELGIPPDHQVVAVIGRLSEEKGHDIFLQAARTILARRPNVTFLIVGDGPLRARLEARVAELGLPASQVVFTGHRTDMANVYATIDLLVISSLTEGIPNVLLEAFVHGTTAVATDVGGVGEVLRDGENGRLVPAGDAGPLAERTLELLEDSALRARMGEAARDAIATRFNFAQRTRDVEQLYEQVLDGVTR